MAVFFMRTQSPGLRDEEEPALMTSATPSFPATALGWGVLRVVVKCGFDG